MKKILALYFLIGFALSVSGQNSSEQRPNIIFILTDDQRWDALGYAGNELAHTPEMDKLASEGVYFKNAMVSTPICAASRATILTGLYERTHRYDFQTSSLKGEFMELSYPKIMREAGYRTGFYGKLGVRTNLTNDLFDDYEVYDRNGAFKDRRGYYYKTLDGDSVHLTRYTGQKALDFIDEVNTDQPFNLNLSFSAPHAHDPAEDQYFWQEESNEILSNTNVPEPSLGDDKYFEALPKIVREGFNRTRWYWRYDTPEKYQHSVKGYHRMIAGIDREIAKIRKKLEEKGIADNTVIILMGDNGYFLGERQLAGKWLMYDNSVRVPLIIFDPRHKEHKDIDEMALNVDVPSTILDFAGLSSPEHWQGKSLVPVIKSSNYQFDRDTVLIEHLWDFENIPPSEGVRTHDWKYLRYVNDQSIEELYNLKDDPKEINNLAGNPQYQEVMEDLRKACNRLGNQYKDPTTNVPQNLMVEFIRKPSNVEVLDSKPEYNWQFASENNYQEGYQILVASSKDNLDRNIGDVWDTGEVRSSETYNIEHKGKPLKSGHAYFWKVRVWSKYNRLGEYSKPQKFSIAAYPSGITTSNFFQIDKVLPVSIKTLSNEQHLIDFGKAAFGTVEFTYQTNRAKTLTFRLGEQLKDGKVNAEPQGNIRFQEVEVNVVPDQTEYLVELIPNKRNTLPVAVPLPDSFPVVLPFRYCEVQGVSEFEIADMDFKQLAYHTYLDEGTSSFSSSDTILNQIWDLCKYSIKATSFAGLYVDGDRERIPYEADAYINQLSHYAVDSEYPIARRTIEYFMKNPTWPTEWQLHVALMVYEDYMYTGNTEIIERYYEELKHKSLLELAGEDGLISSERATPEFMKKLGFKDPDAKLRDIVDWPPAQKDTGWELATEEGERDGYVFRPINTVVNSFYCQNMKIMAVFARLLKKPHEALEFELAAAKGISSLNKKLFDSSRGVYIDGEGTGHASLHANMLPLAFNLVPEEYQSSVVEFIKSRGMACSVYGAQYLMDGLYNAGEEDYALELMTSTGDRSWWNMIEIGSTITLEAWDMKYKPNADWNHAWGAVPGNTIARKMWGIVPKTPGGSLISIAPQLSDLERSFIEVPFLTGIVSAKYEKVNNRYEKYEIDLPANVSAEFQLKSGTNQSVTVNGEYVNTSFRSVRLSPGKNSIEIRISSF
ncbi:family 78 glycoside hydrolase catalytic domain [Membranihabitans maritimus]|uniref:family 78 glycoside hydrolase catalytic domain n=1 Tax=Membranihabitans maritimus TaxID=2904244 RepID=UPI001F3CE2DE|nr:family 78 glycoside hydrolase catalytic domain [Membranihabitans maritimus]